MECASVAWNCADELPPADRIGSNVKIVPTKPLPLAKSSSLSNGELSPFSANAWSPGVAIPPTANIAYLPLCVAPIAAGKCAAAPGQSSGCVACDQARSKLTS